MRLSVVLPVHSERESLVFITDKLATLLGDKLHEAIFIVSPSSPGETFAVIEELGKKYPFVRSETQRETPGLGRAVRQGLAAATGTHVLMMDSDGEMNPETVPLMIAKMEETGCDVVVGSRWAAGGGVVGYSPFKYILNRGFQCIFRTLYRTHVHDLTLGFKLVKTEVVKNIAWDSTLHEIAAETTLRPMKKGYRVEEVPTVWVRRQAGTSKNPFRRNFRYVAKALQILLGR